ncbi:hypothetical protein Gotur_005341 [Gossypium turneri]
MGLVSLSIFTSSSEPLIYIPTYNEVKFQINSFKIQTFGMLRSHW